MRVLVISLLRIGDFLQVLPVIEGLRTQGGAHEVDVLTHHPVKALAPMLRGINHWWTINRDELQEGLGRADIPLLTSVSILKEQLDQISGCEYDAVINLTQTEFSAWVAGYIKTTSRTGLVFDNKGEPRFHSPWFQYLDDHVPLEVTDIFHYTDIFYYGSGLHGGERQWRMQQTAKGKAEVAELGLGNHEKIVLQLCTSDEKKTWPQQSWLAMMTQLQLFRPRAQFVLLGAPAEEAQLDALCLKAGQRGLNVTKAMLSLEGAFSLLKAADLLITGDTSIKHLANASAIPILELSLGSSDLRRTGAYREDSLLLQPKVGCAPCPHSAPCRMAAHDCAAALKPAIVSTSAHHFLAGDWSGLREVAHGFSADVRLFRTRILSSGFWMACDLLQDEPERLIETVVERSTWKFVLNRDYLNPLAQFGSEGIHIKREMSELLGATPLASFGPHLDFLEAKADLVGQKAASLLDTVKHRVPAMDEIRDFIVEHDPRSRALPWLERLRKKDPAGIVEIGGLRRVHTQLERYYQQSQVKMKLLRSVKSQLTESK